VTAGAHLAEAKMTKLLQQLQVVQDELTDLVAGSKLDKPTRLKLAAVNKTLAKITRQLADAEAKNALSQQNPEASRPKRRTLIARAMELLAQTAALVERVMRRRYDDGS
jgi:hypothetical protein